MIAILIDAQDSEEDARVSDDARDVLRLVEPHALPRFARVVGAIHEIAVLDTALRILLASAHSHRAWIPRIHDDGSDALRYLFVDDGDDRAEADVGLESAA